MFIAKKKAGQSEFWIAADRVVTSTKGGFYAKLDETLESFGFAAKVRELCLQAYDKSGVGRPGIDPAVYLKMLMVGFFEDLTSERAIAARCADSIAIRQFLHYETVVDLDTGAIVGADVLPGNQADNQEVATAILEAQQNINAARGEDPDQLTVETATGDKGYYALGELQALQREAIKTVICDPVRNRRMDQLKPDEQRAVSAAARSVSSNYGKELLSKRVSILRGALLTSWTAPRRQTHHAGQRPRHHRARKPVSGNSCFPKASC